jgi:hypothetical protein
MSKLNILNRLKENAIKSEISHQLSACIIKGNKIISNICCNTTRSTYRGATLGSCHAEAHTILSYFGKSLTFDPHKGWYVLWN